MKRTSLQDIANEVGLSKTTVSWILNNKGKENNINPKTIEKVQEVAKEMNYFPNYLAKSLSLGKSNTIGLIVPRITDSHFAQIAETLEKEAYSQNYTVIYGSAEEQKYKEHNLIHTFLGKQVDGLIIASSLYNAEDIELLKYKNFPFVLIDRYYPEIETNFIVVEDEGGAYSIVSELIHKNKKRIGFVTVNSHLLPLTFREEGYKRALADAAIDIDRSLMKEVDFNNVKTSTYNNVKELVCNHKVDAIFFTTHYLAANGFKCLKELDLSIPDDITICCFGDSHYLGLLDSPITVIPMPAEQIGQEALRILLNNIKHKNQPIEKIILPVKTKVRKAL